MNRCDNPVSKKSPIVRIDSTRFMVYFHWRSA